MLHENEAVVQAGRLRQRSAIRPKLKCRRLLSYRGRKRGPATPLLFTRWGGEGALNAKVRLIEPFGIMKISSLGIEEQRVKVIIDLATRPSVGVA